MGPSAAEEPSPFAEALLIEVVSGVLARAANRWDGADARGRCCIGAAVCSDGNGRRTPLPYSYNPYNFNSPVWGNPGSNWGNGAAGHGERNGGVLRPTCRVCWKRVKRRLAIISLPPLRLLFFFKHWCGRVGGLHLPAKLLWLGYPVVAGGRLSCPYLRRGGGQIGINGR